MNYMSKKLQEIGVIGDSDIVLAFRTLGMQVASCDSPEKANMAVHRLVSQGIGIIFITEDIARMIPETIDRYNSNPDVALIPIPGSKGTDGFAMQSLKSNVERAVGANILLNTEET